MSRLLTTNEAAELMNIPAGTLRYWRKIGVGPVWLKLEGTIRYDAADIEAYLNQSRRQPSVRAAIDREAVRVAL